MRGLAPGDRFALGAALLVPPGLTAALIPLRDSLPNTAGALILVVVIVAVAAFGNRYAAWLAAAGAAAWFDFFLVRPYDRFTITHHADLETTLLLLLVGAAITEIAVRGRRARTRLSVDESYLGGLRETSDAIAAGQPTGAVVAIASRHLTQLLQLRSCRFERYEFGGLPRLEHDGTVRVGAAEWDVARRGLPASPIELLVSGGGSPAGRFVLDAAPGTVPPLAARQVAVIVARQVGVSQLTATGV